MGAGTVDMAAFEFDDRTEPPALSEIKEARQCSALAGDEIDRILVELYLRKRGGEKNREDELKLQRTAILSARDLKRELFTTGKCSLKTGWMATTITAKELMEDQNFRTYLTALRETVAASLHKVLARAETSGARRGGRGHRRRRRAPALHGRSGEERRPACAGPRVGLRIGPLSPANTLYSSVDGSLRDVFPQIAMSVGGALVEMMPTN